MFIKCYSRTSSLRRRRYYLLRIIFILLCIGLFFPIKYTGFYSTSKKNLINNTPCANISFIKLMLNCSGDPLQQWCQHEISSCNSSIYVYNKLFLVTRSVILQPKFAQGKRLGGEDIQQVLNQREEDEYFHFEKGFLQLPCYGPNVDDTFSHNHLSNVLSSMTSYNTCSNVETIKETTIAVSRRDYVNIYHTITDLYTVYLLCRFFQRDPKSVRILFLDAHPKGNLDLFWSKLFHSFTRLGQLKNGSSLFYNELIWSQPQLQSEIDVQRHRTTPPSFFSEFREHILQQFNINDEKIKTLNCGSLNIFFLVRHNYVAHPRNPSGRIVRQLSNEKQILDDLKVKFSNKTNIKFSFNHFEELSIEEQLKIIVETDIFVGVHGAGLTHVLFLKPNRVLIELSTHSWQGYRHFELLASTSNINYRRCLIIDGASTTSQMILNCINEKISEMCPPVPSLRTTEPMGATRLTVIGNFSNNSTKI